jgi:multiple sugar transport system permease protein
MSFLERLQNNRNALGLLFMLPGGGAAADLPHLPAGAGFWLGFTDAKVGRARRVGRARELPVPLGRRGHPAGALQHALLHVVASIIKFALGLWLALLLNRNIRFKTFFRAVILLPYIVPTALSAIAFWWIYDAQFRSSAG